MSEVLLWVTAAMAYISVALLAVWVFSGRRAQPRLGLFGRIAEQTSTDATYHRLEPESLSANKATEAVSSFKRGCPCSRVMLATYGPPLGLTRRDALEAGLRFARDMNAAETCGAVTGAFTILAQRFPGANPSTPEGRAAARVAFAQFADQFKARHGTITCRQLLRGNGESGVSLGKGELEIDVKRRVCPELIHDAAEILETMLPAWSHPTTHDHATRLAA